MTQDQKHPELKLNDAVMAVRGDEPDEKKIHEAAEHVRQRLYAAGTAASEVQEIRGCADITKLLPGYAAGTLSEPRALLVKAHLRECADCRHRAQAEPEGVSWTAPLPAFALHRRPALAVIAAVLLLGFAALIAYRVYFTVPAGARATVQSVEGAAYRVTHGGDLPLLAGEQLSEGELVRTAPGAHSFLKLRDGSMVEVNERAELKVTARGSDTTIALDQGAVIVQAAKRKAGHLYVRTPDCRVSVTGTVFSVNSALKGSRVSVFEGEVHVAHAGAEDVLHAGDQVATNPNMTPVALHDEIGWSRNLDRHLELVAQFVKFQRQLDQLPTPGPRYSSDLLPRVPANTVLYASIPNLGETLSEANRIFQDQLQQSDVLREWWTHGHPQDTEKIDQFIEKIRLVSQYMGDEIAVVGVSGRDAPGVAVLADLRRTGLREFLDTQFAPQPGKGSEFRTLDEHELLMATPAMFKGQMLALVRQDVVAFSSDLNVLRAVSAQLNAGPSGFATTDFGGRIVEAYSRGAGFMIGANLQQMVADDANRTRRRNPRMREDASVERAGFKDVKYLIAEHRELNGVPDNHLALDFIGQRRGITSWLAAPAPMGSLEFISRNAGLAFAFVAKSPAEMVNDVMSIAAESHPRSHGDGDAKFQARLQELATYFGGDAAIALDGPVLPSPSWKLVVQVYHPDRLQAALERLVPEINGEARQHGKPGIEMQRQDVNGQPYFVVRSLQPTPVGGEMHYTFADGYMIVAGSRAVLMSTLRTRASGDSLPRSAEFRALLPRDQHANYSAVAYQNLTPVLQPLLSQLSGERAQLIQQLAADARPSVVCAYGEPARIEVVSNSKLFGFDFLALASLLGDMGTTHRPAP